MALHDLMPYTVFLPILWGGGVIYSIEFKFNILFWISSVLQSFYKQNLEKVLMLIVGVVVFKICIWI